MVVCPVSHSLTSLSLSLSVLQKQNLNFNTRVSGWLAIHLPGQPEASLQSLKKMLWMGEICRNLVALWDDHAVLGLVFVLMLVLFT